MAREIAEKQNWLEHPNPAVREAAKEALRILQGPGSQEVKPGNDMPNFDLDPGRLDDLVSYLEGLR